MPQKNSNQDIPKYNISDHFIPLKAIRHLPKILKLEDSTLKFSEGLYLTTVTASNFLIYSPALYEFLK